MQRITCIFVYFLLTTIIISCTTIAPPKDPQPKDPPPHHQSSSKRQETLNNLHRWHLEGKIAVQTARDSGSATINWTQNNEQYVVSLYGPLGTNGIKLIGKPGKILLITAKGQRFSARTPEGLLAKQWGFNLPVSNLKYWIRGLEVPNEPANKQLDRYGRLKQLDQNGWHVQYLSYNNNYPFDLPNKIFITSPSLKTKIIIYKWHVG